MSELNALNHVFVTARNQGESDFLAIDAVIAAGGLQDVVRREYILGRLAASLDMDHANAEQVLDMKGANSKSDERRTESQEKAYGASRTAWSALIKKAGLVSTDKRGGANQKTPPAKLPPASVSLEVIQTPPCGTREQVLGFLHTMATVLGKFESRNSKVLDIETRPIIEDFVVGVRRLCVEQMQKAA
jgi:hypothetical protein